MMENLTVVGLEVPFIGECSKTWIKYIYERSELKGSSKHLLL